MMGETAWCLVKRQGQLSPDGVIRKTIIIIVYCNANNITRHWPPDKSTILVPVYLFLIPPVVNNQSSRLLAVRFTLLETMKEGTENNLVGFCNGRVKC